MAGILGSTLHCCIILFTLFHSSFEKPSFTKEEQQKLLHDLFVRRSNIILEEEAEISTYMKGLRLEMEKLQEPHWTDFYEEWEINRIDDEMQKIHKKLGDTYIQMINIMKELKQTEGPSDVEYTERLTAAALNIPQMQVEMCVYMAIMADILKKIEEKEEKAIRKAKSSKATSSSYEEQGRNSSTRSGGKRKGKNKKRH